MGKHVSKYGWIVIASLSAIVIAQLTGSRGPSGHFVFAEGDIGDFTPWEMVERPVILRNSGNQSVTIINVKTCCGVSVLGSYQKVIPPGSMVAVMLRIRTSDGPLKKEITFETDHPTHPHVLCEIQGRPNISLPFADKGGHRGWTIAERVVPGQAVDNVYRVFKGIGEDLVCTAVMSSPYFEATAPTVDEHGSVSFGVRISPDAPRGKLKTFMFVTTGRRERPTLSVQLETEVERGVRVWPEEAFFDIVQGNGVLTRRMAIDAVEPAWSKVFVETPIEPCLDARVRPIDEGKYELEVSLDCGAMPKVLKGSVVVIHDGQGDRLEIPVLGMKRVGDRAELDAAEVVRP